MKSTGNGREKLAEEIVGRLARRHSTAVVLFHHAVAERLGMGPADHKCLDLLRDRGEMSASELCAITGLTSGAVTGVVARLERDGYLHREADPQDGRRQVLRLATDKAPMGEIVAPLRADVAAMLERFDVRELAAISGFLSDATDLIYRHAALLRAKVLSGAERTRRDRPPAVRTKK